jgi:Protein of unknown function (DUF935)
MGALSNFADFVRRGFGTVNQTVPVPLRAQAYLRGVQDIQPRLSLQTLQASEIVGALATMTLGNPSPMARISDALLQTDPEIKAAVKQLKTAVAGVEFVVTPPNDSPKALEIAGSLSADLKNPSLNLRALKGWIVEGRIRGIGLIEAVWNDPAEPKRMWERFISIPQQRIRINRVTGETQFANSPYMFQGLDVSLYDKGKWLVVEPDKHIQDFALRGIVPALLNDWFGRLNAMSWWNMCLERDAMHTLVGKAGSDKDATALDAAFKNRGAAGAFLIRDEKSSVTQLEATMARSGISPYGEYMTHTAQRMFLALLGESQTGIIEKQASSVQSAGTQHAIARYVIEDLCNDVSFIVGRDAFIPYTEVNYGPENVVNTPTWQPVFHEAVDIVALNTAIGTRPANVELGPTWYRQQTQWPSPLPGEVPLSAPLPPPGSKVLGAGDGEAPGTPGEPPADKMPMDKKGAVA